MENYILKIQLIGVDKDGDEHLDDEVWLEESIFYQDIETMFKQVIKFVEILSD
jgi:hypothetical protein